MLYFAIPLLLGLAGSGSGSFIVGVLYFGSGEGSLTSGALGLDDSSFFSSVFFSTGFDSSGFLGSGLGGSGFFLGSGVGSS